MSLSDYYQIVRYYAREGKPNRVINPRCTLSEAQAHCNDPESSSRTCTTATGKARTRKFGHWFDGYRKIGH